MPKGRDSGGLVIDEVDDRLTEWVADVLGQTPVFLDSSAAPKTGGVSLYLLGLESMPPARGAERPPLQALLRYLVSVTGSDVRESHGQLGKLLFDAFERPEFDVELGPLPLELWAGLGVPPRPGFVLRVPLRKPVEVPPAPPVTEPLRLEGGPMATLEGVVLGPGDVPVADAFVELPALRLATRSDGQGRFRFAGVSAAGGPQELRVRAKAREFPFTVESDDRSEPVALRLDLAKG